MNINNIDMTCAEKGQIIAESNVEEKLINGALDVLHENGLYALFLFLKSRKKEKEQAEKIEKYLYEILTVFFPDLKSSSDSIRTVLGEHLNTWFFAKDIVDRTLVYARYHAKGKKE